MAQSSSSKASSLETGTKKRIKVRKRPSTASANNRANDEEDTVDTDNNLPPAARDSKWVGLTYYNPNFENQIGDEVTDEGEIRLTLVDEEEELPIYNLFPKLREKFQERKLQAFSITDESTTDITKSLVGQTPNFSHMKKTNKINPMKLSLPSLKEIPNEEDVEELKNTNKTAVLKNTPKPSSDKKAIEEESQPTMSQSPTSKAYYDEDDSDSTTNITARKKRRTKKKTDTSKTLESGSSYSGVSKPLNKQKDSTIKPRKNSSKEQKTIRQHSSQGSLADEESV